MKTFSEKVRDARTLLSLSQKELGDLIGVSTRTIVSYETQGVRPRANTLKKLGEALKVSIEYLMNDEIDDPTYGIETEPYVEETRERFGNRAAQEISFLMERNAALFAGGDVPQEAKDAYFEAVMAAYLSSKETAKQKFGRKKK